MAVIGSSGFYDLSPYQQQQVWSSKRAQAISDSMSQTSALMSSLQGESTSLVSVLGGAGGGSLVAMLGGSTDTTYSANAAALFGGGLGSSAEEAFQAAINGSRGNAQIAQENYIAGVIQRRLAAETAAKAGSKVNTVA